jgi:RimJ/RimL family protein N-acetyltransferase
MNIEGKIIYLRAIEAEDLELMRTMLNDPEMEKMVVGWAFPVSRQQQQQWYAANLDNSASLRFMIEQKTGKTVGMITLTNIDWKNRKASHGIKLAHQEDRSRGIGTDAVMALMRYAFDELQLNRLESTILETNSQSRHLYCDKCGWKEEGRQRQAVFKNGQYQDLLVVGILADDYRRLVSENNYWNNNTLSGQIL